MTLTAVLKGYEGAEPALQWQANGGSGWKDISGATGSTYTFTLTEANAGNAWRVAVTAEN